MAKLSKLGQKSRFSLVGVANTIIDFGIYGTLTFVGFNPVLVNYISTTAALTFSYIFNRNFTFRAQNGSSTRQGFLFLAFTLFGLWVLQPLIMLIIFKINREILQISASHTVILATKALAAALTLAWNYVTYSKYVFRDSPRNKE